MGGDKHMTKFVSKQIHLVARLHVMQIRNSEFTKLELLNEGECESLQQKLAFPRKQKDKNVCWKTQTIKNTLRKTTCGTPYLNLIQNINNYHPIHRLHRSALHKRSICTLRLESKDLDTSLRYSCQLMARNKKMHFILMWQHEWLDTMPSALEAASLQLGCQLLRLWVCMTASSRMTCSSVGLESAGIIPTLTCLSRTDASRSLHVLFMSVLWIDIHCALWHS